MNKPRKSGLLYSKEEEDLIIKLYREGKLYINIRDACNEKFWGGVKCRTSRAIEHKLHTLQNEGRLQLRSSILHQGKKWSHALSLKQRGYSNEEISKFTNLPLGTLKSHFSNLEKDGIEVGPVTIKEYQMRQLLIENSKLKEMVLSQKSSEEAVVSMFRNEMVKLPEVPLKYKPVFKPIKRPLTALLEFGDWHLGERVTLADTANLNKYDMGEARKRLIICRDAIIDDVESRRRSFQVDNLVINMLGDMITGENIFKGQYRRLEMPVSKQVMEGNDLISREFLQPLSSYFKEIRVMCVSGNHGRTGRPGEFDSRTNFDYMLYEFLKERLRDQKNIKFFISDMFCMLYRMKECPNFTHLLLHGNEIKSYLSIPYYGIDRAVAKYVQLLGSVNYVHLGHFHSKAIIDLPFGAKIVNGSALGANEHSISALHTGSQPEQLLLFLNDKRGIFDTVNIQLSEKKRLIESEDGIMTPVATSETYTYK